MLHIWDFILHVIWSHVNGEIRHLLIFNCQVISPCILRWRRVVWFFFLDFPFLPPIRLSKNPMRNTRPFGGHVPAKITQEETQSGRRPCQLCKTKGERTPNGGAVMTRYKCTECQVPLCSGDRRHCFFVYHRDRFPAMALSGAGEQRPASFSVSNQPELIPFRKQNYQS